MQNADYAKLDRRFLRKYLAWLATSARGKYGGYARVSVARKLVSLRAFYRFLQQEGLVKINPVPKGSAFRVKTEKRLPDFLTEDEMSRLLEAPDTNSELGIRDLAILEMLYSSGVRLSELADLDLDDLDLESHQAKVFGKGSKERIVLLGGPAVQALYTYLTTSRPELTDAPTNALFLNKYGGRLSRRSIEKIVKKERPPGRHQPQNPHPQHAPHLRDPHAGRWRRPPRRSGTLGSLKPRHHPDLHPCNPEAGQESLHGQPPQGQRQARSRQDAP